MPLHEPSDHSQSSAIGDIQHVDICRSGQKEFEHESDTNGLFEIDTCLILCSNLCSNHCTVEAMKMARSEMSLGDNVWLSDSVCVGELLSSASIRGDQRQLSLSRPTPN